jgi:CrcB protein
MKPFILIGLGSAAGGICRYLAQVYVGKYVTITYPMGTFIVNLTGCFVIGLLYGLSSKFAWMTMEWRLLLITGVCGGYTTFSSFSYESISLFRQGNYLYFLLYAGGSMVLGLLATVAGLSVVR